MRSFSASESASESGPIAVVGAGWSGLSAAFRLVQLGYSVHLYDAAPQAGGRARALNLSLLGRERILDNGQHLLIGAYTQTFGLLAEALKINEQARPSRKDQRASAPLANSPSVTTAQPDHRLSPFLLRQAFNSTAESDQGSPKALNFGRIRRADDSPWLAWLPQAGTALGLLRAQGMSLKDKFAFVRLMQLLKRRGFQGFSGLSVLELLQLAKQPTSLIARIWDPLCVSALNTGIAQACAQTFVNVLQDSLVAAPTAGPMPRPGAFRAKGNEIFPSDYVIPNHDLSQYFVNPVLDAFRSLGGQLQLRTVVRNLDDIAAERIVLATPPYAAANLVATTQPELAQRLQRFDYQSITTVYLAWDIALEALEGGPMLLQEEPEHAAYGQWIFNRGFEAGVHVAAIVVSARGRYAELDNETLSANIAHQVQRQTGLPLATAWRAITEKRATFSCTPDRPQLLESELRFRLSESSSREIFLAGDYCYSRYPATLESAVRSGMAAADRIYQSQAALKA